MKKYTLIVILVITIFSMLGVILKNKNSNVTKLILTNIECLATSENPNINCVGRGSVDCPKNNHQVLFYM